MSNEVLMGTLPISIPKGQGNEVEHTHGTDPAHANTAIVVTFASASFGTGVCGALPWNIPRDIKRFAKLTKGSVVVTGQCTFDTVMSKQPMKEYAPIQDRFNVVIRSEPSKSTPSPSPSANWFASVSGSHVSHTMEFDIPRPYPPAPIIPITQIQPNEPIPAHIAFTNASFIDDHINGEIFASDQVFIMGGEELYQRYMGIAQTIYATVVVGEFPECDTFFPVDKLGLYEITKCSPREYCTTQCCDFYHITYKLKMNESQYQNHPEYEYLNLLNEIVDHGETRPDRTGTGTKALFGRQIRFDISNTVPFITTKKLAFNTVIKELLWFIHGSTDAMDLAEQGVNIWSGNSTREFLDNRGLSHYKVGDVGPMYGHALRMFGACYNGCVKNESGQSASGFDQLSNIVASLKEDPYSRRHLMTTFNPSVVKECALMPCHGVAIQFFVSEENKLSCHVYCRSSDTFLGLSFNIASYAILTYLIAAKTGMVPGELVLSTGDTHVYLNHIDQVKAQLERNPLPFPKLVVSKDVEHLDWADIQIHHFNVHGYLSHPAIKAPMAV